MTTFWMTTFWMTKILDVIRGVRINFLYAAYLDVTQWMVNWCDGDTVKFWMLYVRTQRMINCCDTDDAKIVIWNVRSNSGFYAANKKYVDITRKLCSVKFWMLGGGNISERYAQLSCRINSGWYAKFFLRWLRVKIIRQHSIVVSASVS